MKKPTKSIITSSLLALAFGAMSISTTFALFTSQAKTTIDVGSGEVRVGQTLAIESVSELGNVEVSPVNDVYTNSIGGKTYIDSEDANLLHLENWVPGDKAIIKVTNNNYSNVIIKTRFTVSHTSTSTPDLYTALSLNYVATDENNVNIGYKFMDWSSVEPSVSKISDVLVTIEFPDGDNGEILFGNDNNDNQYQNCNCTIMFTQEAVQGNAHTNSILDQLNAALDTAAATDGRNKTMYDALQDVSSILDEPSIKAAGYVWNTSSDHFYFGQENVTNEYFKIYDSMPETQTNSIYASSTWSVATVNLEGVGFDAGSASGITAVNYVGASEARSNVIRTNSAATSVSVDAPQDTISHYGTAGSLNINAIAGNSYHEHGKIAFAEIKTGRIALETGAEVEQIHLAVTGAGTSAYFNDITVAKAEGVIMPEFSRDPVSIPEGGRLVVALQEGTETVTEQTELDYVWLTAVGIYEQVTVSESSTEAGNNYAVNSTDQEKKDTAQQIANNITANVGGDEYTLAATTTDGGETWTYTLESETVEDITDNVTVTVEENVPTVSVNGTEQTTNTENGLTEEEKEEVKEKLTCEHDLYSYVVDHNYWEYNNNEYEFFEKRVCSNCGTSYVHKHDLVGMYCNECKHMVPLVVDTLDLASGKVEDQTILDMANQLGNIDFTVLNLIDGGLNLTNDTISINDLNYLACFDTGRLVDLIGYEKEFVDNNDGTYSYSENGNLSADDIARLFNDYTVDFTLEFNVDMDLRAIGLAGYYNNMAFAIKPSFTTEANNLVEANTEIPVMGSVGWPITYSYLENVQFLCGLMINGDKMAQYTPETLENLANAKVTLRLEMYNGSRDNRVVVNTLVVPLSTIISNVAYAEIYDSLAQKWETVYYTSLYQALEDSIKSEDAGEGSLEIHLLKNIDTNIVFSAKSVGESYVADIYLDGHTLSGNIVLNGTTMSLYDGTVTANITLNDVTENNETQNCSLCLGDAGDADCTVNVTGNIVVNGSESTLIIVDGSTTSTVTTTNGGNVYNQELY